MDSIVHSPTPDNANPLDATSPDDWYTRIPLEARLCLDALFVKSIQSGIDDFDHIIADARATATRWCSAWGTRANQLALFPLDESLNDGPAAQAAVGREIVLALEDYESAANYARDMVDQYEARKEQRYQDAVRGLPPTVKQLDYLRILKYVGDVHGDRAEASVLIDQLKRGEAADEGTPA